MELYFLCHNIPNVMVIFKFKIIKIKIPINQITNLLNNQMLQQYWTIIKNHASKKNEQFYIVIFSSFDGLETQETYVDLAAIYIDSLTPFFSIL